MSWEFAGVDVGTEIGMGLELTWVEVNKNRNRKGVGRG